MLKKASKFSRREFYEIIQEKKLTRTQKIMRGANK
jgi:hypothetical protein